MGERKGVSKRYPPDFDPSKIPRLTKPKNNRVKVLSMLPMDIRCNTCGNYNKPGTKFTGFKEDVIGENYLGIKIFRITFKCSNCYSEITYKTDPRNSDHVVESGARRSFEPRRAEEEVEENWKRRRDAEEMGDAMKSLENRTADFKRELDILAALDEMKSLKSRQAKVITEQMLEILQRSRKEEARLIEEDSALITSIFHTKSETKGDEYGEDDDKDDLASCVVPKRRKPNEDQLANPTEMSTSSKAEVGKAPAGLSPIVICKSSSIRDSLCKKPTGTKLEETASIVREITPGTAASGGETVAEAENDSLQLLGLQYGSDDHECNTSP